MADQVSLQDDLAHQVQSSQLEYFNCSGHDHGHKGTESSADLNSADIQVYAWPASVSTSDDSTILYAYIIKVNLQLRCSPGYTNNDSWKAQGVVLDSYELSAQAVNIPVTINSFAPDTAEGSKTVSQGVSLSLSGQVGFFGSEPTGGVGSGLAYSCSTQSSISDCTFVAQPDGANPVWEAKIASVPITADYKIGKPVLAAINTTEPSFAWIWQFSTIPPGTSYFEFQVRLTAKFANYQSQIPLPVSVHHVESAPIIRNIKVKLPPPPGQFDTNDVRY